MKLTREEQETHVWGNADTKEWTIYTADPKYIRKFNKIGYKKISEDRFGATFRVPGRCVKFGKLQKRVLSESHLESLRKRRSKFQDSSPEIESEDQKDSDVSQRPENPESLL